MVTYFRAVSAGWHVAAPLTRVLATWQHLVARISAREVHVLASARLAGGAAAAVEPALTLARRALPSMANLNHITARMCQRA